jgi:hypothetical protein
MDPIKKLPDGYFKTAWMNNSDWFKDGRWRVIDASHEQ